MHELSMAQALVGEVERIRARENAGEVLSITVNIGALSGVDRDSFAFAFPLAAEGTCLEKAELVMVETPAKVRCRECGRETTPDLAFFKCGECGSTRVEITGGRDFLIQSIEVRDDGDGSAAPLEKGEHHV